MDSRMMYEAHLTLGRIHVMEGRARIRRQIALIRRLRARGLDCTLAFDLLRTFRSAAATDRDHLAFLRTKCGISTPNPQAQSARDAVGATECLPGSGAPLP